MNYFNAKPETAGATASPPPGAAPYVPPPPPPHPATSNVNVKTASTSVRLAFLRKVYTILTLNFLITVGVSCAFAFIDPIRIYVVENAWVLYASIALSFVSLILVSCIKTKFPVNLLLMYFFILSFSALIASIVAFYFQADAGGIVLQAFCATAGVFIAITAYIFITKKDFSFLYGFLSAALLVLIGLAIVNFVLRLGTGRRSRVFSFAISVLGVSARGVFFHPVMRLERSLDPLSLDPLGREPSRLISQHSYLTLLICATRGFCERRFNSGTSTALIMIGYLLFDTSMVITRLGPDDWLIAVISLYVDVTTLFLYFLNIFSFASS